MKEETAGMVPTSGQIQQFREQGFFMTEPLFGLAELDPVIAYFERARAEVDTELHDRPKDDGITLKGARYFIAHLHEKSAACRRLVTSPTLVEMAIALLGPEVRLYWNQAVIKPPRKGGSFAWHQDTGYEPMEPPEYLTCWLALDDATLENGCIWVIPGSHSWGLLHHERDPALGDEVGYAGPEEGIPVPIRRGQVVAFSSLLLHRSGPNTTGGPRRAYVVQYCQTDAISPRTGEPFGDLLPVATRGCVVAAQPT
jgi:ectoine hydroxylase-related dioxygenase (phytanoyl-CoA dioxygenase family)